MIKNFDWHTATIEELPLLQECAQNNNFLANNYSAVNTILYAKKYKALISINDGFFFEKYLDSSEAEKNIFGFPHSLNGNLESNKDKIKKALTELTQKHDHCFFKNITTEEKDFLCSIFERVSITPTPGASDYIYLTENMSRLPGAKYSKKRNHINQFKKKHTDITFELLNEHNLATVRELEEKWLLENTLTAEASSSTVNSTNLQDLQQEEEIINNALDNFVYYSKVAQMRGGILFVEKQPVAFCLSSLLSPLITDIHFEKCLAEYAKDGGYAVINNEYAKTLSTKYINREEDLGLEGLRKAKRSYYPEIFLEKFDVEINLSNSSAFY